MAIDDDGEDVPDEETSWADSFKEFGTNASSAIKTTGGLASDLQSLKGGKSATAPVGTLKKGSPTIQKSFLEENKNIVLFVMLAALVALFIYLRKK